jgi:hypothetical protein
MKRRCHGAPGEFILFHLPIPLQQLMPDAYVYDESVTVKSPTAVRKFQTTKVKTVSKTIENLRKTIESPWAAHLRYT